MLLLTNLVVQVCFKATRLFTCKHFLLNHLVFFKSLAMLRHF